MWSERIGRPVRDPTLPVSRIPTLPGTPKGTEGLRRESKTLGSWEIRRGVGNLWTCGREERVEVGRVWGAPKDLLVDCDDENVYDKGLDLTGREGSRVPRPSTQPPYSQGGGE